MITVNIATSKKGIREEPLKCICGTVLTQKMAIFGLHLYCENCQDFIGFTIKEMNH